jgi:predicted transcriptional regulator
MPDENSSDDRDLVLRLCARIVASFLSHNPVETAALPDLIGEVHRAIGGLRAGGPEPRVRRGRPAVPVKTSVHHDFILCLEDGKPLKMLKRYLRARYGMTPEEYRRRWDLPPEYPMVAPAYAAVRSQFAKKIGLGRGRRQPD